MFQHAKNTTKNQICRIDVGNILSKLVLIIIPFIHYAIRLFIILFCVHLFTSWCLIWFDFVWFHLISLVYVWNHLFPFDFVGFHMMQSNFVGFRSIAFVSVWLQAVFDADWTWGAYRVRSQDQVGFCGSKILKNPSFCSFFAQTTLAGKISHFSTFIVGFCSIACVFVGFPDVFAAFGFDFANLRLQFRNNVRRSRPGKCGKREIFLKKVRF